MARSSRTPVVTKESGSHVLIIAVQPWQGEPAVQVSEHRRPIEDGQLSLVTERLEGLTQADAEQRGRWRPGRQGKQPGDRSGAMAAMQIAKQEG